MLGSREMRFVVRCRVCEAVVLESGDWFETTAPIDAHLAARHADMPRPSTEAMLFALVAVACEREAPAAGDAR